MEAMAYSAEHNKEMQRLEYFKLVPCLFLEIVQFQASTAGIRFCRESKFCYF